MKKPTALILLALGASMASAQEVRYVTDILQLGLFETREETGRPLRNLTSGAELTVLERAPNYARVRTSDGVEGWVKSLYLIEEKPAQARLAELEARIAGLEDELASVTAERDAAAADVSGLVAEAELEIAAARAVTDTLARLQEENAVFAERIDMYRGALPWPWVAGALLVALGAGFLAGYWWLDASIRRRHGGFRVY